MTEQSTIDFYNQESNQYSNKRYTKKIETYVQFFFNERRKIVFNLVSDLIKEKKELSLLDIACADGVLTRGIDKAFPNKFSKLVGVDISPDMIRVAKEHTTDVRFSFYLKDECPDSDYNIIFGLGYLSAEILEDEMVFMLKHLSPQGYYLCTLANKNSIYAFFKLGDKPYLKNYRSYCQYKNMLSSYFEIVREVPYGLFIPKLWAFPVIARVVQPILDNLFKNIFPNLFHEKVYLLKRK